MTIIRLCASLILKHHIFARESEITFTSFNKITLKCLHLSGKTATLGKRPDGPLAALEAERNFKERWDEFILLHNLYFSRVL